MIWSPFCGVRHENDLDISRPDVMYEKIAADTMMDPWQKSTKFVSLAVSITKDYTPEI